MTQKIITVAIVGADGKARLLEDHGWHRLDCEDNTCVFPDCACPPADRKLPGGLRPSYAQQVNATLDKGKPK